MGSNQSKNEKKFKRFLKKFLAAVVAINSHRKEGFAIEIELANGESIRLTWKILVWHFPGCIRTCEFNRNILHLWTYECINAEGGWLYRKPIMSDQYHTFWEWNLEKVKDFYNGVNCV
jgi:hypothetical protein